MPGSCSWIGIRSFSLKKALILSQNISIIKLQAPKAGPLQAPAELFDLQIAG